MCLKVSAIIFLCCYLALVVRMLQGIEPIAEDKIEPSFLNYKSEKYFEIAMASLTICVMVPIGNILLFLYYAVAGLPLLVHQIMFLIK